MDQNAHCSALQSFSADSRTVQVPTLAFIRHVSDVEAGIQQPVLQLTVPLLQSLPNQFMML